MKHPWQKEIQNILHLAEREHASICLGRWLAVSFQVSVLQLDNKISMQQNCTGDSDDGDDPNPINDSVLDFFPVGDGGTLIHSTP